MFALPSGDNGQQDGDDDDHPLILEGVKADDFRQFLRLLYPEYVHLYHTTSKNGSTLMIYTWAGLY